MAEAIMNGLVELDERDRDDMLPAFYAYRLRKIPGTLGKFTFVRLYKSTGEMMSIRTAYF